jgi:phosphatidylserine decarboxylase
MKLDRSTFPVAWEGVPFILSAVVITLLLGIFSLKVPALFAFFLTLFIVYFFRNPERSIPEDETAVLAPADGVIIYLGNAYEEHLDVEMLKISIFMSVFNVHVNRVPFSGRVLDVFYKRGKFLDARDDKATFENEQSGIILETEKNLKMVVVQVAGLIARRIISYPVRGDHLKRGERYGLIRFGSRVDVYLPKNTDIRVSVGDKTTAGETVLGCLN